MKPRTFMRLALLFPYILWILCVLVVFLLSSLESSIDWNVILMPVTYYAFGIIFWFIPYTVLAMGLWFWSRGKPTNLLITAALISPLLLAVLVLIEAVLLSLPVENVSELTNQLPGQSVLLGRFSLGFGYLCVGITLILFKFLKAKNIIVEGMLPSVSTG